MSSIYIKNDIYNFYQKANSTSIMYSDGSEIEDKLYTIIKNLNDKSVWSDELKKEIIDWPTEYHFSRQRHCLLRPLNIKRGDSVLELGAGCGAITRYLGELGAIVDSVEGTASRARIAGERCSNLENVKVHVDNFLEFTSNKKYDWVLFIGVLEYAPLYSDAENPIESYLEIGRKYIKPSGKLVIAIENKLGLKYFNGCAEDHLDEINLSIENRYQERSAITFGKRELSNLLHENGFEVQKFFYPFPDYKLPTFILDQRALSHETDLGQELLRTTQSRDYLGRTGRIFEESLVWPELAKNGVVQDLSNSFLIVAEQSDLSLANSDSKDSVEREVSSPLAFYYNCQRKSEFVTETRFEMAPAGIVVIKKKMHSSDGTNNVCLHDLTQPYISGLSLQNELEVEWNKYKDESSFITNYRRWISILKTLCNRNNKLPGSYIDLTPFNIKMKGDQYFIFDQEWSLKGGIPLEWLVYRGIYWSLVNLKTVHAIEIAPANVASKLLAEINIPFGEEEVARIQKLEREFLKEINGSDTQLYDIVCKVPERVATLHYKHLDIISELRSIVVEKDFKVNKLDLKVNKLEAELDEIRSSLITRAAIKLMKILRNISK
ncbi:hypothetical protein BBB57_23165 [Kosakonia sacchari]|uniref:class I SAM-dependent methyltransferase n=1 Tax=Kosakonia sacchari TaxID=1158459 RepID=UPI0008073FE8|nr:methyltransferase domain-containing protein [Kosakonia sacchari]ANR80892.1 hypothetical protein BBB57_23165 [Kosakonia sacchari]